MRVVSAPESQRLVDALQDSELNVVRHLHAAARPYASDKTLETPGHSVQAV